MAVVAVAVLAFGCSVLEYAQMPKSTGRSNHDLIRPLNTFVSGISLFPLDLSTANSDWARIGQIANCQ